jgi:DNA-directed RNA polymerase alpha subunit
MKYKFLETKSSNENNVLVNIDSINYILVVPSQNVVSGEYEWEIRMYCDEYTWTEYFSNKKEVDFRFNQIKEIIESSSIEDVFIEEKEISIDNAYLSMRAANCLKIDGLKTVQQVAKTTQRELLKIPNLGKHTLKEIVHAFKEIGIDIPR